MTPDYCAKHNWIVGSPRTVIEKIEKIYDEVGGFGQLLVFGFDYVENPQAWRRSLELLSKEVHAQGAAPQARRRRSWRRNRAYNPSRGAPLRGAS